MKIIFNNVERNIDKTKIIEGLNVLADHAETMPGTDGVMTIEGVAYNVGGTAYTTPKTAITAGLENYKTNPTAFASTVSSIDNAIIAYVVEGGDEPVVEYSVGLEFYDNEDGTCTVYGLGECADTDINIPPVSPQGWTVTSIKESAFEECSELTSVTIPDTVTSIGSWAFEGCAALTDVYFTGAEEQWNAMSIGRDNENLTNATIHYNYVA